MKTINKLTEEGSQRQTSTIHYEIFPYAMHPSISLVLICTANMHYQEHNGAAQGILPIGKGD